MDDVMMDEQAAVIAELRWLADGLPAEQAGMLRRAANLLDGWQPIRCGDHGWEFLAPVCPECDAADVS